MFSKKAILLLLFVSSVQILCAQDTIWMKDLKQDEKSGRFLRSDTDKPYSGFAYEITNDYNSIGNSVMARLHLVKGNVKFIIANYPSGKRISTMKYGTKGPKGNVYTEYYENGRKKKQMKYQYSTQLKIWKHWNSNGKICKIVKYDHLGNIEETKLYNENCED